MDGFTKCFWLASPVVGVVMLFFGFHIRRRRKDKVAGFLSVVGTVVRNLDGPLTMSEGGTTYRPVVEYFVGKRRYEVTSDVGHSPKKAEGSQMKVLYHPMHPAIAVVANAYLLGAYIMIGTGSAFTLFGGFIAYLILFPDK